MKGVNDDTSLVIRCKRELPHQHGAFEELVNRYKNGIYTLCFRMVGDTPSAEDLMQEIFMRVFVALQSFEERSAFSTWLYRIAYNQCLSFLAKRQQDAIRDGDFARESAEGPTGDSKEVSMGLEQTLLHLGKEQRSVLIMKYLMDLEIREIAEALGLSESAVKMRLLRAREELRSLYVGQP